MIEFHFNKKTIQFYCALPYICSSHVLKKLIKKQRRNKSWKPHLVFSNVPKPYAFQSHMVQTRFQIPPVVTANLHEPETAFVCLFRPHKARSSSQPYWKRSHSDVSAKFKVHICFPCREIMQLLNITHILSAGTCQIFWLEILKKPCCIFSFVEICVLDAYPVPFMIWKRPPCSHSALNQIAMASTWKINQKSFYTKSLNYCKILLPILPPNMMGEERKTPPLKDNTFVPSLFHLFTMGIHQLITSPIWVQFVWFYTVLFMPH